MKKEAFIHFSFLFTFFVFIFLAKRWFSLVYIPLWFGGILGTVLPDIDHILYLYINKHQAQNLAKLDSKLFKRQVIATFKHMAEKRDDRTNLMFHRAYFQLIFLVLTFLVVTSSGSIFGRGLVLAFSLHLLVDQLVDLLELGSLDNWFRQLPVSLDKEKSVLYWVANAIVLMFIGFLL